MNRWLQILILLQAVIPASSGTLAWSVSRACSPLLIAGESWDQKDFGPALLGTPVTVGSNLGPLRVGIIDVDYPGVAESLSQILVDSISDARESNARPGHLPDHLVDDVIQQYISPDKIRTFWRFHSHRFVALNSLGKIVGTLLLATDKDTLLYLNRWTNNVPAALHPGVKPEGYHQMMNLSVRHALRRSKIASILLDTVTRHFRHLFNGKGIWMRADPPWHDKLVGLGFLHDPAMDAFLPAEAERTLGMSHAQFNAQYRCSCPSHFKHNDAPGKLQYLSFTRDFEPSFRSVSGTVPRSDVTVDVLIVGGGIAGTAFALKLREIDPSIRSLVISKNRDFSLSGQGHLYPMTQMEEFRFPGRDATQPDIVNGVIYPGELERALLANQTLLNVWNNVSVDRLASDGSVLLSSGEVIRARKIVIATGSTATDTTFVDPSAQGKVETFVGFLREIARLPYVQASPGSWGRVAIIGDGAGGQVLARRLKQDAMGVAQDILLIGEHTTHETATHVAALPDGKFKITVRASDGSIRHDFADRVVTTTGYNNDESMRLAQKLNTRWMIGSAANSGANSPIVSQLKHLSEQAELLYSELKGKP